MQITSVMRGSLPSWLLVTLVTTFSVSVCLVMLSVVRPRSAGGGGNSNSLTSSLDSASWVASA